MSITSCTDKILTTYLGRYRPSIDEFLEIEERIHSNPLEVKSHILSDLQDTRKIKGEEAIPTSTFYRQTALNEYFFLDMIGSRLSLFIEKDVFNSQ
jgi:ribosomal 30S subunit maturation factor RimM